MFTNYAVGKVWYYPTEKRGTKPIYDTRKLKRTQTKTRKFRVTAATVLVGATTITRTRGETGKGEKRFHLPDGIGR